MQRFDAEMRETPTWRDWEANRNHKFAFIEGGRRYPMKEIISLATGTSKDDFSGGEESIRFAKKLGFDVESLRLREEFSQDMPRADANLEHAASTFIEKRVFAALLLFNWRYGGDGFAAEGYVSEERNYKLDLSNEWRRTVSARALSDGIEGSSPEALATEIGRLLNRENFLPWRYADAVRSFSDRDSARSIASVAVGSPLIHCQKLQLWALSY